VHPGLDHGLDQSRPKWTRVDKNHTGPWTQTLDRKGLLKVYLSGLQLTEKLSAPQRTLLLLKTGPWTGVYHGPQWTMDRSVPCTGGKCSLEWTVEWNGVDCVLDWTMNWSGQ